ncbi:serine protease, partial [Candidatus Pelagibacter bacterium]|nr:serine protease [Candidatus Pelagibacter bacterium]
SNMKKLLGILVIGLLLSGNAYAKLGKIKEANEEFVYYTVHSFWPDKARAANMDEMIPIEVIDHCGKYKKNTYKFYGDNGKGWGATRNPKRYICARNSDVAIQIAKNSNSEWQKKFEIRCNKTGFSIWTNRSNKPRNVKGEYCYHISIKEERYQTWNTEKEKLKEAKKKKVDKNNSYLTKLYRPHPKEIRWMVDAKSYYNQKPEYPIDSVKLGFSKISFMVAAKNALNKCREDMEFNGGKPDGCLVSAIQTHGKIKRYIELGVFDKSIEFYEKNIIAKKPKKKEITKPSPDDNKVVPAGSGSGFFVSSEGHIITNHHVIDGCNTTKVNFKGNQIEAQILAVDKTNDIAILKANIKPNRIFPVSNDDVSLLEDVVVAGYPLGKKVSSAIKTHKGVVTALAGAGDNYSNFQTDATINAGNSGGPIMNQKGNIVGIAVQTWVEEGVQGIHFGIKSSTLKTFANSNSLKFSQANNRELSNKDLGKLITEATVYLECHMTIAKIKKMIAAADNRKAFFSKFKD